MTQAQFFQAVAEGSRVGKAQVREVFRAVEELVTKRLKAEGDALLAALAGMPGPSARLIGDPDKADMPAVELSLDARKSKRDAASLLHELRSGRPRIELRPWRPQEGLLIAALSCLRPGDGAIIAEIYKERVMKRGYGSGMWGWKTAYADSPTG